MNDQYDICIVGAGPIGGYLAHSLSGTVDSIALFEQHKTIGAPLNCAGLVTPRVFKQYSIPSEHIVQNEIKGAHIHSPSGEVLSIGGDKVHAVSIDRRAFDTHLVTRAKNKGTDLFLSEKIVSIQQEKDKVELTTATTKKFIGTCVIGADGPYSKVRDLCGFPQPKEFLRGMGAVVDHMSLDPDFVEIFVGDHIAPGFFAWMIPTNKEGTQARIGLCVPMFHKHAPHIYFQNMFKEFPMAAYLKNAKVVKKTGGIIPLGPLSQTVKDNVLLVGDAAAQVKPTSGGGIYPGLLCATHCVNQVKKAFASDGFSQEPLQDYHQAWRKDLGRELSMGMQFRKIYKKLTNRDFDKYIEKFNTPTIRKTITEKGDIDYPSTLVGPLIKKMPSLIRLLPRMIH